MNTGPTNHCQQTVAAAAMPVMRASVNAVVGDRDNVAANGRNATLFIDIESAPGSYQALIDAGVLNATEHAAKDSSEMEQSQGRNIVNGSSVPLWNAARDFFYEQALGINLKVLAIESDIAACLARRKAARPDRQAAARRRG